MRNLRKVLALVLTLAMMLSVMVMNVGAFTDDKDIQHKEAAAVANAIEVLKGYTDGTYGPEKTLTRAEAATICARLLLTPEKADALKVTEKPFDDVEITDWFAPYVAYCQSENIINGVGNNNFDPEGTLTVAQFSKILLGALGYDATREGMTGSAWAINTAKLAQKCDLLDDVIAAFDGDCTRDDAAQMILNLLLATLVEYDDGDINVTTSDGTQVVVNGKGAEKVESDCANKTDETLKTEANGTEGDGWQQFAEEYFPDLKLENGAIGDFGRPGQITWTNDKEEVYSAGDTSDAKEIFVGDVKKVDMYKAIGSTAYKGLGNGTYELYFYQDGEDMSANVTSPNGDYTDLFAKTGTAKIGAGDGVVTEVYVTTDVASGNPYVTVCQYAYYLAKATDDYDAEDESVTIDSSTYDTVATVFPSVSRTNTPATTLDLDDFSNITGILEDDWLLMTISEGNIVDVIPATIVEGTVTGFTKTKSVTVDGTKYTNSAAMETSNEFPYAVSGYSINDNMVAILDANGYLLGYDDVEGNDNYVFVGAIDIGSGLKNSSVTCDAYFADGTYDEYAIKSVTPAGGPKDTSIDGTEGYDHAWYTYTLDGDKLVLKEVADSSSNSLNDADDDAGYGTEKGKVNFYGDWSSGSFVEGTSNATTANFLATSKTVFLVLDEDDDITVYTGYSKIPAVKPDYDSNISAYLKTPTYVALDSDGVYCEYVFIDASDASVKGGNTSSSSDLIFIYDVTDMDVTVDANDNEVYSYGSALVNGKEQTVESTKQFTQNGLFCEVTYDEDGYVDDFDVVADDTTTQYTIAAAPGYDDDVYLVKESYNGPTVTYSNGVLTVDADQYPLADGYKLFAMDVTGQDWDTTTTSKLTKGTTTFTTIVGVMNDDDDFTALYFCK